MMPLSTLETVFPFKCSNPSCGKEYSVAELREVALLWGFIYLVNGPSKLIGLTCPHCHHTTVKKYAIFTRDFSISIINNLNKVAAQTYSPCYDSIEYFIPFSARWLTRHKLLEDIGFGQSQEEYPYSVPEGTILSGPFAEPLIKGESTYRIFEFELDKLLNVENEKGWKVFPRIVSRDSVYVKSSNFGIDPEKSTEVFCDVNQRKIIDDTFFNLIKCPHDKQQNDNIYLQSYKRIISKFDNMIDNDMNLSDYNNLIFDYDELYFRGNNPAWRKPTALDSLKNFLNEYLVSWSKKNFELKCFSNLFNKYARIIYLEENWPVKFGLNHSCDGFIESCEGGMQQTIPQPSCPSPLSQTTETDHKFMFRYTGDFWEVSFNGIKKTVKDRERLKYIVCLLDKPNHKYDNTDLELIVSKQSKRKIQKNNIHDSDINKDASKYFNSTDNRYEEIDTESINKYKEILKNLIFKKNELYNSGKENEFAKTNELNEYDELDDKINKLVNGLQTKYGLFVKLDIGNENNPVITVTKRPQLLQHLETLRKNIHKHINLACKDFDDLLIDGLSAYLKKCIVRKGSYTTYDPSQDKSQAIEWKIIW